MATITVRNLDDEVQRRLKRRAADNNRSMEAEARAILTSAVTEGGLARAWLAMAQRFRGDALELPKRSTPRDLDLS